MARAVRDVAVADGTGIAYGQPAPPAPVPELDLRCGHLRPRRAVPQVSHLIPDPVTRRAFEQFGQWVSERLEAVRVTDSAGVTVETEEVLLDPALAVAPRATGESRLGRSARPRARVALRESAHVGLLRGELRLDASGGGPAQELALTDDALLLDIANLRPGTPFSLYARLEGFTLALDPMRFDGPRLTFTGAACGISFMGFPSKIVAMGTGWA